MFNNGALGFIELEQKSTGFLDFGTELNNPNFAAMAKRSVSAAFGSKIPPTSDDGIAAALAHDGPVLCRCGCEPDGARHAAFNHPRNGEGLLALHGEGNHQRSGATKSSISQRPISGAEGIAMELTAIPFSRLTVGARGLVPRRA